MSGKDDNIAVIKSHLNEALESVKDKDALIAVMQQQLIAHEEESAQLANKLSVMKQEMMENEMGFGMDKKFGCVRIHTLRNSPCTVSCANFYVDAAELLDTNRPRPGSVLFGH